MKKKILLWSISFCALALLIPAPVLADDPDKSEAIQVAEEYLQAFVEGDFDTMQGLTCYIEWALQDVDRFERTLEEAGLLDADIDLSGLEYEPDREAETWVEVLVTGDILIEGIEEPLTPADIHKDRLWLIYEADAWKVCSRPPIDARPVLGPDETARLFIDAAFSLDFATAHLLICSDQQDVLSEARFHAMFKEFEENHSVVDFSEAIFEITEQTETEAVVAISGDVSITWDRRDEPLVVSPEDLGLAEILLLYEDGWTICNTAVVES